MKAMKRTLAFFLCVVMNIAMGMTAFADDVAVSTGDTGDSGSTGSTVTVTIPEDLKDHTFEAYQIFTGTQEEDDTALGGVEWGNGIDEYSFLTALKNDSGLDIFEDCETAADVANVLGNVANDSATAETVAKIAYSNKINASAISVSGETTEIASGYYLIVDTTDLKNQDDTPNASLLQVTQDITIQSKKLDKPTLEKKVCSGQDEKGNPIWDDAASYEISGNPVVFELIGTVPDDLSEYTKYKYTFYDTMDDGFGLSYNIVNSWKEYQVSVYFDYENKKGVESSKLLTNSFEVNYDEEENQLIVGVNDLKTVLSKFGVQDYTSGTIRVIYNAYLNDKAVVGGEGNVNTAYLEYYNDPKKSSGAEDENDVDNESLGRTANDEAVVYIYQLNATKVDATDRTKVLKDAEFRLFRLNDYGERYYCVVDKNNRVFGWIYEDSLESTLADARTEYPDYGLTTELISNDEGNFSIAGVGSGTWYLEEIEAPKGYNKLSEPIELKITDTMEATALAKLTIQAGDEEAREGDTTTGIVSITVKNNKGAILPETGGMGTTIFYVVGGLMMAGAAVLLITRKRMGTNS